MVYTLNNQVVDNKTYKKNEIITNQQCIEDEYC